MNLSNYVLKPCPFCNGSVSLVERSGKLVVFLCEETSICRGSKLGTYAHKDFLGDAVKVWNTRLFREN